MYAGSMVPCVDHLIPSIPALHRNPKIFLYFGWVHICQDRCIMCPGAYEGGLSPRPSPYAVRAPSEGGSFNITSAYISLPQAIYILHCIALHSPKLKDYRKRIEINSDSQQYLCVIKYCIKHPCFPFLRGSIMLPRGAQKMPPLTQIS